MEKAAFNLVFKRTWFGERVFQGKWMSMSLTMSGNTGRCHVSAQMGKGTLGEERRQI